jgi:4-aminobutyrate aminotransferase-like enzyme
MPNYDEILPHVSPVWSRLTPIIASRGEGAYIYDQEGVPYLDFTCGIAPADRRAAQDPPPKPGWFFL